MMKNHSHPGRSPEFLSRLYDGELAAAERAHFESHRAHCAECRKAAADFDAALSLYRSAKTSPAAPDLAARVLRKLQAGNPPRRDPFGIFFGINLKWAGAFAAALIAMIIGSSVLLRQQGKTAMTAPESSETPIRATLPESRREESPGLKEQRETPARPAAQQKGEKFREALSDAEVPSEHTPLSREEAAAAAPAAPAPPVEKMRREEDKLAEAKASAPPKASPRRDELRAESRGEAQERRARGQLPSEGHSGGEAAASGVTAMALEDPPRSLKLTILPWDGEGNAPERLQPLPTLTPEYRGREYVLMVDALGRVQSVRPYLRRSKALARDATAVDAAAIEPPAPEALKSLRFAAGDRPRRLLLRIE